MKVFSIQNVYLINMDSGITSTFYMKPCPPIKIPKSKALG